MERGERRSTGGGARGGIKRPRKLSARYLENAALFYLRRYAATVSQLRRVLGRKAQRSLKFHGGDAAQAQEWIDALIAKLVRNGLLNDAAYARMKAQSLRASGRSARVITQKLRIKGVDAQLAGQETACAAEQISEEDAARTWARKKRLGPFRKDASTRADNRQRDLGSLARAGFSFAVARSVIDGDG